MIYKRRNRESMKLHINNSNYTTEAIDDIKKYYPRIPDDVFVQLIQLNQREITNCSYVKTNFL